MATRRLVWVTEAIDEYAGLLERRSEKQRIRECVERHLLSVAANMAIATSVDGPAHLWLHRIRCHVGETVLNLQAVFEPVDDDVVAVLACNTIRF